MADVGLPLVSRRSLQRGDRRRPPFIFTKSLFLMQFVISILLRDNVDDADDWMCDDQEKKGHGLINFYLENAC